MNQRIRVIITAEGWYYLGMLGFIVAGAVIRDINLLYIMAGMMLGPLLFSFFASTRSLRKLAMRREYRKLIGVGDQLVVEVTAEKPSNTTAAYAVVARDTIRSEMGAGNSIKADASLFFAHVPSGGVTAASYTVRLNRRGRYQLGPMQISSSMPLGLIRASLSGAMAEEVLVSPQIGQMLPAWSRYLELNNDGGQKSMRRLGKREGDFYGMREWRDGDSRHWIHWRTSAKRNKLAVRQFEQRINQDLVVILDLWRNDIQPVPKDEVEQAISFAATLAFEHGKDGSTHLMFASVSRSSFFIQGTSSPVFQRELLERLAIVKPTGEDNLSAVMNEVLPQAAPTSKVVVITTRDVNVRDTDQFAEMWNRTNLRRLLSDVVCVNTTSDQFGQWFRAAEGNLSKSPKSNSQLRDGNSGTSNDLATSKTLSDKTESDAESPVA